jgi:hypothetical protein
MVPRAGFEPATTRSSASPPLQRQRVERSPRLSYLGMNTHKKCAECFLSFLKGSIKMRGASPFFDLLGIKPKGEERMDRLRTCTPKSMYMLEKKSFAEQSFSNARQQS